ncbi:excisionase family DNA binding domain-containing protein [Campylobacter ureolyticus ACS-301-V-Sch3b]|uniref:Excisionase family DNA binding domain-containing protein n=1 Tax=Campylobacter ureolyticus ACS-301-V-Sch3b TaxID=883165 RepID=S3XFE4_9BACT|nr:helix-turn-helix domain-containing protein [Campylobacter ureolyticus]EPH08072.1 excisionase family DNA binding domain-containing protein [Campylobacter ureolyticus ACS-301-V-Sch3b]
MENTITKQTPRMLRASQVAKLYSVSIPTVWRLVASGKLKTIKPTANITLFKADEVDEFFTTDIRTDKKD